MSENTTIEKISEAFKLIGKRDMNLRESKELIDSIVSIHRNT